MERVVDYASGEARAGWRVSEWWIAAALIVLTFLLSIPTFSNFFVDYDDPEYVTGNRVVQGGLTREGLVWAFTTTRFSNWLPVTWLSHMADVQVWGMNAGGHHATSALLHAFNAAALFLGLRRMTGRLWAPAATAALFAAHPLRVESVAWVAERKDVLCGTFFMLALLAYAAYARRPSGSPMITLIRSRPGARTHATSTCRAGSMALLSMCVTWPTPSAGRCGCRSRATCGC